MFSSQTDISRTAGDSFLLPGCGDDGNLEKRVYPGKKESEGVGDRIDAVIA
jgi:hypothetical protein